MGYFSASPLGNDDALDWLAQVPSRNPLQPIRAAVRAYLKHANGESKPEPYSAEEIEEIIQGVRESHTKFPPKWWLDSGREVPQMLDEEEKALREHFVSGRYLDEEYGPVEEFLAAAELLAIACGYPSSDATEAVREAASAIARKDVPKAIWDEVIRGLEHVLSNEAYRRMRQFYLDAFPETSGGSDDMQAVRNLLTRVRACAKRT